MRTEMTKTIAAALLALTLAACTTTDAATTDAATDLDAGIEPDAAEPTTCPEFAAITTDATEVGEVQLEGSIRPMGISYPSRDGLTTWAYEAKRRDGRLGAYGTYIVGRTTCRWADAIAERTPATGQP